MALTRLERNQLVEAVRASALDPAECSFVETGSKILISHKRSSSTFELSKSKSSRSLYEIDYYVDDGHHYTYSRRELGYSPPILTKWANEVKATFDAPDLWAELGRSREPIVDIPWSDIDNTPFTNDERRQIRVELETIKEHVKEQFDLTSEQIARIDERLDEAAEAAERIGRKDWRLLLYGTVLNLVVADALPPEVARHILTMIIHVVVVLFGGGTPQILA